MVWGFRVWGLGFGVSGFAVKGYSYHYCLNYEWFVGSKGM